MTRERRAFGFGTFVGFLIGTVVVLGSVAWWGTITRLVACG